MNQNVLELQGQYMQGKLSRREFIEKLSAALGAAAALSLLSSIESTPASAEIIPADDSRLQIERITYPGETGEIRATLAHPKGDAKLPGLIIIHENRGLNPHIEDVGRRFALEGFLTIAPDALSPLGGTPQDPDEARTLIGKLDAPATVKNYVAAVQYLKTHPLSTGKVGCMGFCWGGGMTNQVAVNAADLDAAVPFYGMPPAVEDVPKINAPLLLHYAGNDERINAGIAAYEDALKKASIPYTLYMYEGAQHAFFNDTSAERYNKEAAQLAWERTLAFLNEKLKT